MANNYKLRKSPREFTSLLLLLLIKTVESDKKKLTYVRKDLGRKIIRQGEQENKDLFSRASLQLESDLRHPYIAFINNLTGRNMIDRMIGPVQGLIGKTITFGSLLTITLGLLAVIFSYGLETASFFRFLTNAGFIPA